MKAEALDHTKMARLQRSLKLARYEAVGILETVWQLTARQAPRGNIGKLTNDDIATFLGWPGGETEADQLVSVLVYSGWLDTHPHYRLVVHDWPDHAEDKTHMRLARAHHWFWNGERPKLGRLPRHERGPIFHWYEDHKCDELGYLLSDLLSGEEPPQPQDESTVNFVPVGAQEEAPLAAQQDALSSPGEYLSREHGLAKREHGVRTERQTVSTACSPPRPAPPQFKTQAAARALARPGGSTNGSQRNFPRSLSAARQTDPGVDTGFCELVYRLAIEQAKAENLENLSSITDATIAAALEQQAALQARLKSKQPSAGVWAKRAASIVCNLIANEKPVTLADVCPLCDGAGYTGDTAPNQPDFLMKATACSCEAGKEVLRMQQTEKAKT